jgi:outer membrane protein
MLIRCTPFLLVSALAAAAQMPAPLPAAPTTAVRLASNAAVPVPDTSLASPTLTRTQAEALALRNNPRASISHLLALAQHQIVREWSSPCLRWD